MVVTDSAYNAHSSERLGEGLTEDSARIVLGIVFFCVGVFGLGSNAAVIHTFRHSQVLQTPSNTLIIGCVICDITMILIGYPFVIASYFYGDWLFGAAWCEGYGFVMTLFGVSSICILTAIAIDRYFVVTEAPFAKKITTFKAAMTILSCFGYGLLWATFPLVGWGRFVVEPGGFSCGPDWANRGSSPRSYTIVILVLVFFLPVSIISFCYFRILVTIQKNCSAQDEFVARARSKERNVAMSAFLVIVSFMMAWAPYAVMSIWIMINDVTHLSPVTAIVAPLLAKSTSAWNPLVYVARNKQYREALKRIVFKRVCVNNVEVATVINEPTQGSSSEQQ